MTNINIDQVENEKTYNKLTGKKIIFSGLY